MRQPEGKQIIDRGELSTMSWDRKSRTYFNNETVLQFTREDRRQLRVLTSDYWAHAWSAVGN